MSHNQVYAESSICNRKYVTNDLLKLPDNVSIICDDGEVRANMELLSVRSDFFARVFNNPGFLESQNKSIRMEGCTNQGRYGSCQGLSLHGRNGFQTTSGRYSVVHYERLSGNPH